MANLPAPGRRRLPTWAWEGAVASIGVLAMLAAAVVPSLVPPSAATAAVAPVHSAFSASEQAPAEPLSLIGLLPFNGSVDAPAIEAHCHVGVSVDLDCVASDLHNLLMARGSEVAFGALENLTLMDALVLAQGHALAHGMGRAALDGYGGVRKAIAHCPFVLASGCFHGVLQSYFDSLRIISPALLNAVCPDDDGGRWFQCLHGLGHGLELFTNYDLPRSLGYCDQLVGWVPVESCRGGVFMENLVGYQDARRQTEGAGGHNHGGPPRPAPVFWVNRTDPLYPCDAVDEVYVRSCYDFQSSVALEVTDWDFRATATMCDGAPASFRNACFQSLGRDIGGYTHLDAMASSGLCELGNRTEAEFCIRGYAGDVVNDKSVPHDGIVQCAQVHEPLQEACFEQVGALASGAAASTRAALCADAQVAFRDACRKGAGLGVDTTA